MYQDSETGEKMRDISMEYSCRSRKIWIETWIKDLDNVFSEKKDLQLLRLSILFALFGVPAM